jgi:hypothetical protein
MLIIAFICFASLILGWLLAPTSAPAAPVEAAAQATIPEPATAPA